MTVKFNQYWRIDPEKVPDYEKYVLSKFIYSKGGWVQISEIPIRRRLT